MVYADDLSDDEGQLRPEVADRLAQEHAVHRLHGAAADLGAQAANAVVQGVMGLLGEILDDQNGRPARHQPPRPVRAAPRRQGPLVPWSQRLKPLFAAAVVVLLAAIVWRMYFPRQVEVLPSAVPLEVEPPRPAHIPTPLRRVAVPQAEGPAPARRPQTVARPPVKPSPVAVPEYTRIGFHGFLPDKQEPQQRDVPIEWLIGREQARQNQVEEPVPQPYSDVPPPVVYWNSPVMAGPMYGNAPSGFWMPPPMYALQGPMPGLLGLGGYSGYAPPCGWR